ncbi:MAG: DNA cytosine methyltransferase [Candidatus Woesearchaeota archaeon]
MVQYKVLDLFAGAGGFSYGFSLVKNGAFEIVKAIDINDEACETLTNHIGKDKVMKEDLTNEKVIKSLINKYKNKIDVIIGGPPCQTFSLVGPSRSGSIEMRKALKKDPRNILFKYYLKLVKEIDPRFVVFENVEGITSKSLEEYSESNHKNKKVIELICDELDELGYNLEYADGNKKGYTILNAAEYGVPQNRRRVFVIAGKKEFINKNPIPEKTHGIEEHLLPFVTVKDAIGDLPPLFPRITIRGLNRLKKINFVKSNLNTFYKYLKDHVKKNKFLNLIEKDLKNLLLEFGCLIKKNKISNKEFKYFNKNLDKIFKKANKKLKKRNLVIDTKNNSKKIDYRKYVRDTDSNIIHHNPRSHNIRDIIIFTLMKPGTNSSHFINENHEYYNDNNLIYYLKNLYPYDTTKHVDTYVKHKEDLPSKTILAHLAKDGLRFIHPTQLRSFTPREAARLQSFPDSFKFEGSMISQFRQIGNAVPPLMAKAIGEAIYMELEKMNKFSIKNAM